MNRTRRAATPSTAPANTYESLALWINRGLETLWLLAAALVPLVYFNDAVSSLPTIDFWAVAKVTLLRTLVGLMVILWLAEIALRGWFAPQLSQSGGHNNNQSDAPGNWLTLSRWLGGLAAWLRGQPDRWLILAVILYLASVLLSTALSASLSVSLWGEVPGLDNYSAHTVLAYVALFGVLVTHLKTPAQLHRLLAALIGVGVLAGSYGILQHYGLDFLKLTDPFPDRVGSTLGNPIFLGSFLVMTIPLTLAAAAGNLQGSLRTSGYWWRAEFWVAALLAQFLGLAFTVSRGPIGGVIVAVAVLLLLTGLFAGWRNLVRAGLTLVVAVVLAGSIVYLSPSSQEMRGALTPASTKLADSTAIESVGNSLSSYDRVSTAQGLSGRIAIWQDSGRLMVNRPWFSFDSLSFPWLRFLIGYGPDLFRATYLLEGQSTGFNQEVGANHAHNFFVHQGVEIGILGLLTTLGIFAAGFLAGLYQLWREGRAFSSFQVTSFQRLLLVGLLAALAGRFVEQMVGVAQASDLTLFWILLALLALRSQSIANPQDTPDPAVIPDPREGSPRPQRRAATPPGFNTSPQSLGRLALLSGLAVVVLVVTWTRDVNYLRAAQAVSKVNTTFENYDLSASLAGLDRAIGLAPDVVTYYNYRAAIYNSYRTDPPAAPSQECQRREPHQRYDICLAEKAYQDNQRAVAKRPFHLPSRIDLTDSAATLGSLTQNPSLTAEATRTRQEVVALAPQSWKLKTGLAQFYIRIGQSQEALPVLEEALAITGDTHNSAVPLFLRGLVAEKPRGYSHGSRGLCRSHRAISRLITGGGTATHTAGATLRQPGPVSRGRL